MSDLQRRLAAGLASRYTLERELGRGGMSIVYLAHDLRHGRRVALKVLRPEIGDVLGPERFLLEIKVAAGLAHPHILPLFDSGVADDLLFYTMPYVEGESLRHRLLREGRLPVAEAVRIACDVADALSYAHDQKIVHRDIKPENILLESGHPVVSDFGIARAINEADESRLTGTGIAVGTADYMSPEQAAGEAIDGRGDIYSLACVLYEMLVGRPPFGARSPSGERALVTAERAGLGPEIERAIRTALAPQPSERFATAREFAAALQAIPAHALASGHWLQRLRRRWRTGAAAAVAVAVTAVLVLPQVLGAGLNPALYVVVPFGHRDGAAPTLFQGDQCELRLYEELDRWSDVKTVDRFLVSSERHRRGARLPDLQAAMKIARAVGSGMLIWGELWQDGDSIGVRGALYDVRARGRLVRAHTIRLGPDLREIDLKFRELTDSLLLGRVQAHAVRAARSAGSVTAWLAYARGDEALQRWAVEEAADGFAAALAVNPDFPQANLWLAQTRAWMGRPSAEWVAYAARALAAADSLSATDREAARGLLALGQSRYPDACESYRRLVAIDPNDFVGWYGLGECQARDRLVIRSAASPSGWAFRSSQHDAITSYRRALELVPAVHRAFAGAAYPRLEALFYTQPFRYRSGYALLTDTMPFAAHPGLVADTLSFVPHPRAAWLADAPGTRSSTLTAALAHNRSTLRAITATWAEEFPSSADALETHARVLETVGELAEAGNPQRSALDAVRAARRAAVDSRQRLRLAVADIRLRMKLERFEQARAAGDSLLAAWPTPDPDAARQLAGVAVIAGRVNRAAALLAMDVASPFTTPDGDHVVLPASVAAPARDLLVYAAVGAPAESLAVLERRIASLVESWIEPQRQAVALQAALHEPAMLAFPQLSAREVHAGPVGGNYLLGLQRLLARDPVAVRAALARVDSSRGDLRAGDVASEIVYQEAWLLLAVGDTAAAVRRLDRTLTALPALGTALLDQVPQAAGLVRAMVLRADLAAARGDGTTAARWARAVTALWRDADPALGAVIARMAAITSKVEP